MKRMIAFACLLVVLLTFVSCGNHDDVPDGMQNVAIETANFNLYVPATWSSTASSGISGAKITSSTDNSNVTVTCYYPYEVYTPEKYWNEKCAPNYREQFADFQILEHLNGDTTLGGVDAKKYVFSYTMDGTVYQSMQVITVYRELVYTLTYTAKADLYGSHTEEVDSIVKEFTFR